MDSLFVVLALGFPQMKNRMMVVVWGKIVVLLGTRSRPEVAWKCRDFDFCPLNNRDLWCLSTTGSQKTACFQQFWAVNEYFYWVQIRVVIRIVFLPVVNDDGFDLLGSVDEISALCHATPIARQGWPSCVAY